ncbi:hypothetical protein [Paraburkholderia sp. BCC1886]|uniref:hypothetical protein n=1 Tax=Paraburkholderia sp. BCC1886 TaxID=2562670 RepID=UPI001182385E|nr:hypothetical protein [Paraburkholderia sp. BCC1886]
MTTHIRERGRVTVYACGGGGINIGHKVARLAADANPAFAELRVVCIDTSKSNLHAAIDTESTYLIESANGEQKDGSGQERRANHADIAARVPDILLKFKPTDLNIVLSTGSGGSGSVIAPSILSEILARDGSAVAILVGDDSTKKFTENTLNTIKSYEKIATVREQPVVVSYLQNSAEMTRAVVDQRIESLVSALCVLYSRQNRELDSKDLYNWVHFQKITSHRPSLASLTLIEKISPTSLTMLGNLISIATLTNQGSDPTLPVRPEVQFVGYLDGNGADRLEVQAPFHYVISDGVFGDVSSHLNGVLREMEEQGAARLRRQSISTSADQATDSGLVL